MKAKPCKGFRLVLNFLFAAFLIGAIGGNANAQDTSPPFVVSTDPTNGATGVSPDLTQISITFNEPIDSSRTSHLTSFSWGTPTAPTWSADQKTMFIGRMESEPLSVGATISVTLLTIKDLAGNPLSEYTFAFTIGTNTGYVPIVLSTDPSDGATGVSPDLEVVSITFSEPMDSGYHSINTNFPSYSLSWDDSDTVLNLTRNNLQETLPSGTTYTFTLNPVGLENFRDKDGNFLPETVFSFTVEQVVLAPTVVSTDPSDGAIGVSTNLQSVSISFSTPMRAGYSISSNFPGYSVSWSADKHTITLTRNDPASSLVGGMTYSFILNGGGSTSFRDFSGVPLEEYTFSFATTTDYELIKIPANAGLGFHWPYYLSIPHALSEKTVLLVEPNNTGGVSDDPSVHDQAAENLAKWRSNFAVDLDVPLLVPTFPRPFTQWVIYTHALDRDSLLTTEEDIRRIDLQLIAMIEDAQQRLTTMGYEVSGRVFINGYSASGSFANRFTLLHPEIVQAAAIGSPGGWPTVPVSEWEESALRYPVGTADLASLIGKEFELAAFQKVPQYIYVGDIDDNDAVDFTDGFDQEDRELIDALFGDGAPYIAERWPHAEEIFDSIQSAAQFVIYPGVAHSITPEMFADIKAFFEANRGPAFDLADVILVLQVMNGVGLQNFDSALDMNEDNQIGTEDAICLLQEICGLR